jgi:BirA family biotin operon repressor/biotin-[acetyl-CoA-carboxylase] ligase
MLNAQEFQNNLQTIIFGRKIFSFDTIDSTNECAKLLAECGSLEGTMIISENQTSGRGRFGREWQSETGKNLLFSIILRPKIEMNKVQLLTFFITNCIAKTIETIFPIITVQTKWPNDLLINYKKFCGLLLESSFKIDKNFIVCGIGLNVNQLAFSENLTFATSIRKEINKEVDRYSLLDKILKQLDEEYPVFLTRPSYVVNEWKKRNILTGLNIKINFQDNIFNGKAIDIDELGCLVIRTDDNRRLKFFSGDVIIKI